MLSIIIINYYTTDLIKDCINSLYNYHQHFDGEIIIVNNGESDDNVISFQKEFKDIIWIEAGYNAGFARANNIGIRKAQYEHVLLLNPDIIFIEPILIQCVERFSSENSAACGVQLLNEDLSFQISGSYFIKGGLNHLLPIPYWGNFLRWLAYKTNSKKPHAEEGENLIEVDWINGAYLMTKKRVLAKAGLLDEDFFMYAEETEWCSRLKKEGNLHIYGDLKLVHLIGRSSKKSEEKEYYDLYSRKGLQMMVSTHLRIRKQFGVFWLLFLYFNYFFGSIIGIPFSFLGSLFRFDVIPLRRSILLLKNVILLASFLPKIIQNRPGFYKVM